MLKESNKMAWVCCDNAIKLLDTRSYFIAGTYPNFCPKIGALTKISEYLLCFGGDTRIGIMDKRNNRLPIWLSDDVHEGEVRDLALLENLMVSSGTDCRIIKWRLY